MNLKPPVLVSPQTMEEAPSPRLVGTHMHPDIIPTSFYEKKAKVSFSDSKLILLKSLKEPVTSKFCRVTKNKEKLQVEFFLLL